MYNHVVNILSCFPSTEDNIITVEIYMVCDKTMKVPSTNTFLFHFFIHSLQKKQ